MPELLRRSRFALLSVCLLLAVMPLRAVVVRGRVTDPLGAGIANADVALVQNGQVIVAGKTQGDGSYYLSTSSSGRFYVLAGGKSFRQLVTESFYGGTLDAVEQNVVLEPEWVRQSVVVTATGTPLPQGQVSASITGLSKTDFLNRADMVDVLRQVAGTNVVQQGQRGGLASIFVRGGNSDANKVLFDGAPIEDIGGRFDLSTVTSTGVEKAEVYRGPNSVLYGSDAAAGVIGFSTPRGSTPFPSLMYEGDAGNFGTYRNEVQLGGTHRAFDYYGGFSDLQTKNSIPQDEYHNIVETANLGWAWSSATTIRGTFRNADIATGLPNAYQFYQIANDGKQSDQNIFASGTIDHTFSDRLHGLARYGLARKREESTQWSPTGIYEPDSGVYLGLPVTIQGANGYSVSGQAILNYAGTYPVTSELVSNRDNLYAQADYQFSPHMLLVAGFRFEDERGKDYYPGFLNDTLERANYDYMLQIQGDFRNRLFYSLGGGVEKNQLYGTEGTPRVGLSYYVVRPGAGVFHGTKLNFNFAKGVKEPTLTDQFDSLYQVLNTYGGQGTAAQFGLRPIGAERSRSYDGGVEQSLFSERVVFRATYFHNEFGNQIESVPATALYQLLPDLPPDQLQQIIAAYNAVGISPTVNSLAFRAQGVESEVQYGIGKNIFLRGGYTYLDSVVQRSFSSDALQPTYNTSSSFPNVPIGVYSPLRGARPFRRPPHTGFVSATYTGKHFTVVGNGAFSGRSDDSTFLGFSDANFGNSLLLPNRNLDAAYAKLDLGLVYQISHWVGVYTQLDNLLSNQHIGPIGYPSLPFNFRTGLRLALGKEKQ
ncbi:MAG TPA: TonB-dependent receptor [Pseudacidobacterium sp.]|nr:TonB-dependent receptor [Pseudacidobacterium sp.]